MSISSNALERGTLEERDDNNTLRCRRRPSMEQEEEEEEEAEEEEAEEEEEQRRRSWEYTTEQQKQRRKKQQKRGDEEQNEKGQHRTQGVLMSRGGKIFTKKRLPEPLRFMSDFGTRSFDEESEEEEEEENGDEKKQRRGEKEETGSGTLARLILQISLGAVLLLVVVFGAFRVIVECREGAVVGDIFVGDVVFYAVSVVHSALVDIEDSAENDVYFSDYIGGSGVFMASFCSTAMSIFPLYIGFAGLFGIACGLGYGLSQQMSSFAPFGQGLGTGLVTSARAFGAFMYAR